MVYGPENILLFNLSVIVGWKSFSMVSQMQTFVSQGVLPSNAFKKRQERTVIATSIVSVVLLTVYIILSTIWYLDSKD